MHPKGLKNMKKNINTIDLVALGLPALALIGVILRLISLLTAFDSGVGYFDNNALITYIDRAILFAAVAFGIIVPIITKKDAIPTAPSPVTLISRFASFALGFVFAICALLFTLLSLKSKLLLSYVVSAGAIVSAIYYIYEGFCPVKADGLTAKRTIVAIISIVGMISIAFIENFDFTVALNSSEKLLSMFTFVLAPIFIIQKLKFGTEAPSSRLYLCASYLTAFLGTYFSILGIIANCAGVLDNPKYLLYYLLAFTLAIYAFIDLTGRIRLTKLTDLPAAPKEQ